jgi:hypothetical protein
MDPTKTEMSGAEHHEAPVFVPTIDEKLASGQVRQVQTASVALAAAIAAQKPSLLSKNMFKLYFISELVISPSNACFNENQWGLDIWSRL